MNLFSPVYWATLLWESVVASTWQILGLIVAAVVFVAVSAVGIALAPNRSRVAHRHATSQRVEPSR